MALQIIRRLYIRIRTHKPTNERVINPAIHVDDAHLIDVLMHGEASVYGLAGDGVQGVGFSGVGATGESALTPGVIGQALNHHACAAGDGDDAA